MAKQKGIIKLKGKVGDLSFLKTQDGFMARERGGVDAEKIKNDAAFARTRENMKEFGTSASAGKLLRDAVRPMLLQASDNRVTARLTDVMADIKNLDPHSDRGSRTVGVGIGEPGAKLLLKGFNFNKRSVLNSILYGTYSVDTGSGEISFAALVTNSELKAPRGATHVNLQSAWARVNFENGSREVFYSPTITLPINPQVNAVSLLPGGTPSITGTDLYLLLVEFFQEVNGQAYALNNGAYNALGIVEVA